MPTLTSIALLLENAHPFLSEPSNNMSNLIPLHVVNLALDMKDLQIKTIADENERTKELLRQEQERLNVLLTNNYRLRTAIMSAIELHKAGHAFTEVERIAMWNQIEGSLV